MERGARLKAPRSAPFLFQPLLHATFRHHVHVLPSVASHHPFTKEKPFDSGATPV